MDSSLVKAVGFVHLRVHSAFSLRQGALSIEALAKLAKADSMPALAITDTNNLFGALEFSEKLAKSGVQPIIGAQITVDFGDAPPSASRLAEAKVARAPLALIAKDEQGYRALMRLASRVWLDPTDGDEPHVGFAALAEAEGLIALTGGPAGPIDRALALGLPELARSAAEAARAAVRRPALCRTAAPRAGERAPRRAGAARPRLCAEPAAGRRQRGLFRRRRRLRGAGRAAVRRRRRADQRRRPPPPVAGASLQDPRRNARAVRRSRGGARQQRRDRAALRLPAADPQADPAALHRRRRRAGRRGERAAPPGRRRARAASGAIRLRAGPRRRRLPPAARIRARRHRADEVPRLLPHRRRLHQMGEGAGHSGRTGARLGRRLGGRLVADHHRSRSAAVRPAVRALPQSRARVDARLRRRLLPGPARRGHRLCAAALRRGPRRADHHLRLVPRPRRDAQRRPGAGNAARPGRQARQAGAAEPGQARDAEAGGRRRAAAARGGRSRPESGDDAGDRPAAGGALFQRLDPRRRRRHRRPAAGRAGAALPRPEVATCRRPSST